MQVLLYNELNPKSIAGLSKLIKFLENDNFDSADVKKSVIIYIVPSLIVMTEFCLLSINI